MSKLPRILKRSRKQERATSRDLSGYVQPGSGNGKNPYSKEDVNSGEVLCQCKTTEKGSFSIKKKEFDQTEERSLRQAKMPAWRITLQDTTDLAVIRWADYIQLLKDAGLHHDNNSP